MTMKKLLLMVFVLAIGIYAIGQQPTTIKNIKTVPQIEEHGATNVVPYVKPGNTEATGDDCSDPIIINIPGGLPFTDANQTTCGRINNYDATCLGSYDGGEDIMYEIITRRKPSDKFMEYAQITGMVLLFALLIFANGNDIIKLFRN